MSIDLFHLDLEQSGRPAVKREVAAIEELAVKVTWAYDERRSQTWLERQFDDPGDRDDPVGVLEISNLDLLRMYPDGDPTIFKVLSHLER